MAWLGYGNNRHYGGYVFLGYGNNGHYGGYGIGGSGGDGCNDGNGGNDGVCVGGHSNYFSQGNISII